ncbi:MAG: gliding motility-associated protein GldC [Flavobacteriales bacterium]|jgi:gliding motility-associated protein GldC
MSEKLHYSDIKFRIGLDENKIPKKIDWIAEDAGMKKLEEAKAIMLSVFDPKSNDTLRIDLWTNEMKVDEMKRFFHQTLISMSDTFERATNEKELAEDLRKFCKDFGEKL